MTTLRPEFVTVLIGVNDVVQGVPPERYEANVVTILDALLARLPADRIVTVAIPDYTVTPAGADYGDPRQQHDGIVANNAVMARLSGERDIAYVDIFDISLRAADDRSLVADDGLHPGRPSTRCGSSGSARSWSACSDADAVRGGPVSRPRPPESQLRSPSPPIPSSWSVGAPTIRRGASPSGCRRSTGRPGRTHAGSDPPR